MSFWNSEKLRQKQTTDKIIEPFEPKRIKHGAYDLSLGPEVFVSTKREGTKQELSTNEQIIIPPGQFGLLLTQEVVAVPKYAIGFISIKFSIKMQGLVNVSGFHVDPGFRGRLKFAVYNAGSQNIPLSRGEPVFIIWFSDLSGATDDVYNGEHSKQTGITSYDVRQLQGEIASPAELKKQIDELKLEFNTWRGVIITLLITILAFNIKSCSDKPTTPSNSSVQNNTSREAIQEDKQSSPVVTGKSDNAVSTPSSTPAINTKTKND